MSQFIALLRREHHEHKGAFFWAPIVVLALVLIAGGNIAPQISNLRLDVSVEKTVDGQGAVHERREWRRSEGNGNGESNDPGADVKHAAAMGVIGLDVAGRTDRELRAKIQPALRAISLPFYWIFFIIALFGCIACMHDERKDRSVLFWKSMPVSDTDTVLSKYIYLAWLAPIVTVVAIVIAQLFSLSLLSILVEDGMGGRVWTNSGFLTQTLQLVFGFLLNGLNLLPIFGWLIFASAWFNSVPFVWALGVPFWLGVLEAIVLDTAFIKNLVVFHAKMPTLPRLSLDEEGIPIALGGGGFVDQIGLLGHPQFWVGAVVGVLFLVGAVIVRGRKNEI